MASSRQQFINISFSDSTIEYSVVMPESAAELRTKIKKMVSEGKFAFSSLSDDSLNIQSRKNCVEIDQFGKEGLDNTIVISLFRNNGVEITERFPVFLHKELIKFKLTKKPISSVDTKTADNVAKLPFDLSKYVRSPLKLSCESQVIESCNDKGAEDELEASMDVNALLDSISTKDDKGQSVSLFLFSNLNVLPVERQEELKSRFFSIFHAKDFQVKISIQSDYIDLVSEFGIMKVHRSLFRESLPKTIVSLSSLQNMLALVLLCVGGKFAGAICRNGVVLAHKALHRYVVRAKQGGRQVTHDKSSLAVSMGSTIRRHQEERLVEEVQSKLGEWAGYVLNADLIFVYAPSPVNSKILFGDEDVARLDFTKGNISTLDKNFVYKGEKPVYCLTPHAPVPSPGFRVENYCVLDKIDARISSIPFNQSGKATTEQAIYCYRSFFTAFCQFENKKS